MTSTPPPTTLSTPSPTTQASHINDLPTDSEIPSTAALQEMNLIKTGKPIHLVVATSLSPPLGIGHNNQLPWPSIKSDMSFFRKATTGPETPDPRPFGPKLNAVIMGRKTYDSIPAKFRPLASRVNVILTRSGVRELADGVLRDLTSGKDGREPAEYRVVDQAVVSGTKGQTVSIVQRDHAQPMVVVTDSVERAVDVDAKNLFCIGGAEIYGVFLRDKAVKRRLRVLQTLVGKLDGSSFECDTFWPEELGEGNGWKEVSRDVVEGWVGVSVPQGGGEWFRDEKVGVEVRTIGWERVES